MTEALRRELEVRSLVRTEGFGRPGQLHSWQEACVPSLNQYFLLRRQDEVWLGRKVIVLDRQRKPRSSSVIEPHMVMGRFLGLQVHTDGATFQYRACSADERYSLFDSDAQRFTALEFPFPVLDNQWVEQVSPPSSWETNETLTDGLDADEQHFREHGAALAADFLRSQDVIYDPACSTGTYLGYLARRFPHCHCVGSDLSTAMARRAARTLPRVLVADAGHAPVTSGSVSLLIIRFLNAEVVHRSSALSIFHRLARLVVPSGRIFVFGHTPVLLDMPAASRAAGLRLQGSVGLLPDRPGIFQFYVLAK